MRAEMGFRLKAREVFAKPFAYFTAEEGLGAATSLAVLEWLETCALEACGG